MPGLTTNAKAALDGHVSDHFVGSFVSNRWILETFFHLTDQEMNEVERQLRLTKMTPLRRLAEEVWID